MKGDLPPIIKKMKIIRLFDKRFRVEVGGALYYRKNIDDVITFVKIVFDPNNNKKCG